jgi:N-methylhydantoinase B
MVELRDGERIVSITCGGGGYGPPAEREPEAVRRDVVEGWISAERARAVYRVALTDEMEIAVDETSAMRSDGNVETR